MTQMGMCCEYTNCRKLATCDCKRKGPPFYIRWLARLAGYTFEWQNEPIALCEEHSQGRKIIRRFKAGDYPGQHPQWEPKQ